MNGNSIDLIIQKKAIEDVQRAEKEVLKLDAAYIKLAEDISKLTGKNTIPKLPKEYEERIKNSSKFTSQLNANNKEAERLATALARARARLTKINTENSKSLARVKVDTQEYNKNLRRTAQLSSALIGPYRKLAIAREKAAKKLQDLIARGEKNNRVLRKAQNAFNRLDKRVRKADKAVRDFRRNVGNYPAAVGSAIRAIRSLAGAMGLLSGAFIALRVIRDTFDRIREFDKEMQNMAGILRTTRPELADLEEVIKDVAGSSVTTSNEIAKLASALLTLGKSKEEVKLLLSPVNDLALGLNAAADESGAFLVGMLNAFQDGTEEAGKYADQIATIRTSTSLDFQKMRDSFAFLAPVSRLLGKDLAFTGSLIGILADNTIKAESAGRLLSTAQIKLATSGKTLDDGLEEINKAIIEGKSEIELLALSSELFGKNAAKIGIVLAANSEEMYSNAEAIRANSGALDDLVGQQLKSLDAQLKILDSTWEQYLLDVNDSTGASNTLRDAVKFLSSNLKEIISTIILVTKAYIAYRIAVKLAGIQTYLTNAALLASRKAAVASARGISTTTVAFKRFNAVLKANALGLTVTAITALVFWLKKAKTGVVELSNEVIKNTKAHLEQQKASKENIRVLSEMADRYDVLKDKTELSKEEQKELNDIILKIAKDVPGAVTEMDKYGGAIEVSSEKTKEFIKLQKELNEAENRIELKKNREALEELQAQQERLNKLEKEGQGTVITGIGVLRRVDGVIKSVTSSRRKHGNGVEELNDLTKEQIVALKNLHIQTEKNIISVEDNISALTGEKNARQKLVEEIQREAEAKEKQDADNAAQIRNVGNLTKKIKDLKDEQLELTAADAKRADAINLEIEALEKEIKAILRTKSAIKEFTREIDKLEGKKVDVDVKEAFSAKKAKEEKKRFEKVFEGIELGNGQEIKFGVEQIKTPETDEVVDALQKIADKYKDVSREAKISAEKQKEIFGSLFSTFSDFYGLDLQAFQSVLFDKEASEEDYANAAKSISTALLSGRLQKYDAELQANKDRLDRILNDENATEEQKREAQDQADKREKEIRIKQAKAERTNTLIQIGIDTAAAVAKALAQTGTLSPLFIPGIIAAGATQAAFVASQPLPQFLEGTENAPAGDAITDELGPELRLGRNNKIKSLGSTKGPRIQKLDAGDKIIPADRTRDILKDALISHNMTRNQIVDTWIMRKQVQQALDNEEMVSTMKNMERELKKYNKRPLVANVTIQSPKRTGYRA